MRGFNLAAAARVDTTAQAGATIFTGVGVADPFVSQIILNAVNVLCTFLGIYNMERFGRRRPLIIGALGMFVWLMVFSTAGTVKDPSTDKGIGYLCARLAGGSHAR